MKKTPFRGTGGYTVLFQQNYTATAHTVINQGGTSSGKTYAIIQALFCLACQNQKQVVTVVGQDIPNLKAGALRDALSIYDSSGQIKMRVKSYNRSDRIFEFHNGSSCCRRQTNLERRGLYSSVVLPERV